MDLGEVLERVAVQVGVIGERLAVLESKVDAIVTPPKALRLEDAEKHLPLKRSAIKALIAKGEIQTVRIGKRRYIPLTEILRLTTVTRPVVTVPSVAEHGPKAKRRPAQRAKAEADEILAFAKSL